jgi:hypothetical protein
MKQIKLKFSGDGSPEFLTIIKIYDIIIIMGGIYIGLAAALFIKIFSVGREVFISSLFLLQDGARLTSSYE